MDIVYFGDPESPNSIAFAGTGVMAREDLEAARTKVVQEANGMLEKLRSPYRL